MLSGINRLSEKSEVKIKMADRSDYTAANRLIHKGPCIVKNVLVSYTGATYDKATIYDGENDKGKLKAVIVASATVSGNWTPGDGTDFDEGIYVKVGTTIVVTVTYEPESRKDFV